MTKTRTLHCLCFTRCVHGNLLASKEFDLSLLFAIVDLSMCRCWQLFTSQPRLLSSHIGYLDLQELFYVLPCMWNWQISDHSWWEYLPRTT